MADFACQAIINYHLKKYFPNDAVVAEESSKTLSKELVQKIQLFVQDYVDCPDLKALIDYRGPLNADRYWTVDPIDGTKGFIRMEQYAVCVALIEKNQVVFGVLGCPSLPFLNTKGCIYEATKNNGAFISRMDLTDRQRISVSNDSVRILESHHSNDFGKELSAQVALKTNGNVMQMDSQCKYALLSSGSANIYFRFIKEEKIWDHAAGSLIVTEAGGFVCDANGNPLEFQKSGVLKNYGIIATSSQKLQQIVIQECNKK